MIEKRTNQMKGKSFTGKAMSKGNFERYGPLYTSVDIMGYAISTDYQPIYSGLTFSDQKEKEVHFLSAHEIFHKRFRNDLIVLPNHGGIGENIDGRGLKALVGAFQIAKCRNVAISLWQLKGSSNQELLNHFYRNLYSGIGKARSLQEAKLLFLSKQGKHQHPYYWSSLVLYGDNIELEGEDRPWWSYGALFFALFMILLIFFGFRRKRRR